MRVSHMRLNIKQTICLDYFEDSTNTEILYGGGAGGGKSVIGSYGLLKQCLKYQGTRWLMGRSKLKTLKETTLNTFFWVCNQQGIKANIHYKLNSQSNTITFINGSEILLKDLFYYPSDPNFDELGSLEITGAFIDEVNQVTEKAVNIVNSRIRYKLDCYNLIPKTLGACNPSKGYVYSAFYKPYKNNTLPEYRKFIPALVTDNPDISKHYIDNLNKLDRASKERLLFGNWEYDDDPATLINYEKIIDLFVNSGVPDGTRYITCDVARMGNDKTVIRVWSGLRSIYKVKTAKTRTTDTTDLIRSIQRQFNVNNANTIVDEDGVGGGVVDQLRCKGFIGNSKQIANNVQHLNYSNLRSQCYFKLSELINENKIYIYDTDVSDREMITQELEHVKQRIDNLDGKLSMVSKDDIKKLIARSPDESDCLMMRMYFELENISTFTGHKLIK